MSDFAAKFLRDGRKFFSQRTKRSIHLGAFGKHPGWDDHMDDIGLETETLLIAKQLLYAEGIGGVITSGEWDKLAENEWLPVFNHVFVWKRGDAFLLGKMWASRDGKRREKYPLILCLQCHDIPLSTALLDGWPVLETCEQACKETKSPDEVKAAIARARAQLSQQWLGQETALAARELHQSAFMDKLAAAGGDEAFFRILYHLRTQMPYNLVTPDGAGEWQSRAGRIRLPAAPDLMAESLAWWIQGMEGQLGQSAPILAAMPLSEPWLDLIIGRPSPRELQALRSTPQAMPIASDIPYEIDARFRDENSEALRAMRSAGNASAPVSAESKPEKNWLERILSKG